MPTIDYIVIIVFTILIVLAGLSFRKRGSDMKSYFAAGGAVPWPINGLSLYMSFFSAGTFVVWGFIQISIRKKFFILECELSNNGVLQASGQKNLKLKNKF